MLNAIAKPFGLLMMWLYDVTNQYGVAVILFALIVKLILLWPQMKAKHSTLRMSRLTAQMKEIEKKHGANRQKYNEELQKLYREEGINPGSGCLWTLIPFPILLALYHAIRYPLTTMMGVPKELLEEGGTIAAKLAQLGFEGTANSAYIQIEQSQFITNNWASFSGLSEKLRQINYNFLGLDLGAKPDLKALGGGAVTWAGVGLLLIPVIAAVLSWLQSKVATPKKKDGEEPDPSQQSMKGMMIVMPFITLWFAYMMPAALGVYWIASSAFAIIQDVILNKHFTKVMAIEDAERNAARAKREAELEAKRAETERLKAENATTRNTNTSKKKLHLSEREEKRGKAAEWQKRRDGEVIGDEPSRVGDRKYARGRAYDPDRYVPGHIAKTEEPEVVVIEEAEDVESVVNEEEYEVVEVEYEDDNTVSDDEDDNND